MVVVLTLCGQAASAAVANQVPFTATGTAVITGVTHLPGGLIQLDGSVSGNATHLGEITGPVTRIQDHQGNFVSTIVLIGANGTDSVFLAISGDFEKARGSCGVLTSTGTYTVTGGTGAFANATGSGTITTEIDECADSATASSGSPKSLQTQVTGSRAGGGSLSERWMAQFPSGASTNFCRGRWFASSGVARHGRAARFDLRTSSIFFLLSPTPPFELRLR